MTPPRTPPRTPRPSALATESELQGEIEKLRKMVAFTDHEITRQLACVKALELSEQVTSSIVVVVHTSTKARRSGLVRVIP